MNSQTTPWLVGVDDFATETQRCAGWTYFALPEQRVAAFESAGRHLLNGASGLHNFHGKKYKEAHGKIYKCFLHLVRAELEGGGYACNTLISRGLRDELIGFAKGVVGGTIRKARGLSGENPASDVAPYAPVLFTALRALRPLGPAAVVRVQLDDDASLPDIAESKVIVLPPGCSRQRLLQGAVNAYRSRQFPKAPQFGERPVEKMRDNRSMLIQAADVIGNFSLAYVFTMLGDDSKRRKAKAGLLSDVFGDTFSEFDFQKQLALEGGELRLNEGGAFDMRIELLPGSSATP